ncbi:MAG: septum formation initiator family protein, partial [Clostridiales Family XIII bacterium]|nr:septum formation initiator family protein [Clostridiales Family XIII bacterium]
RQARRSFITVRRVVIIAAVAVLAVFVTLSVREIRDLKKDAAGAKTELALKQEQKENLEAELANIKDPEYIEKQARERLRMVKPGETIYIYEASTSPEEANDSEAKKE